MSEMWLRFLSGPDIDSLGLSNADILAAVEEAVRAHGDGRVVIEPRVHLVPDNDGAGHFNVLRGHLSVPGVSGVKVVGDFVSNYAAGLPSELGLLTLYDPRTGVPLAIMDATLITACRTGAMTAVGARYLARPDARVLGHVGARGTEFWNVVLLDELFDLEQIRITSRRPESREAFARELAAVTDTPSSWPPPPRRCSKAPTSWSRPRGCGCPSRALTGVTDSPAFLDGQFTGTAGFHGIDLAAHCDQLTAAFCHAAEVAAARVHRLLDPAVTGLPAQLAREPGPQAGLTPVHKRAAGEVHTMRRLATATTVGLIETSGGQEDVQSFAWEAAEKLAAALRHARAVTACELLAGYQAAALSGRPTPAGTRALLDWMAGLVDPIEDDRPFGEDLQRLIEASAGMTAAPGPE